MTVPWAGAAALLLVAAVLAARPPHRLVPDRRSRPRRRPRLVPSAAGVGVTAAAALIGVALVATMRWLPPGVVIAAASVAATVSWVRHRDAARRLALRRQRDVAQACAVLAGELEAGQPPDVALAEAAEVDSGLATAARAAAAGHDTLQALREAARADPCYRRLVLGWELSVVSGSPLAATARRVRDDLTARDQLLRRVTEELAPARATARVLAGLPVLAMIVGHWLGFDPWAAVSTGVGQVCLVVGVLLAIVGLVWIERLADTSSKAHR